MRKIGSHGSAKPPTVNAAAAAIDIGSKLHMAAVDPACADNPFEASAPSHGICISSRIGFNPTE